MDICHLFCTLVTKEPLKFMNMKATSKHTLSDFLKSLLTILLNYGAFWKLQEWVKILTLTFYNL